MPALRRGSVGRGDAYPAGFHNRYVCEKSIVARMTVYQCSGEKPWSLGGRFSSAATWLRIYRCAATTSPWPTSIKGSSRRDSDSWSVTGYGDIWTTNTSIQTSGAPTTLPTIAATQRSAACFTSSISVYGALKSPWTEESPTRPGDLLTAGQNTRRSQWASRHRSRRLVIARPAVIFGPGRRRLHASGNALRKKDLRLPRKEGHDSGVSCRRHGSH